jgi:hypothetical protein
VAPPRVRPSRWRLTLFRVLAVLLGLVYLPGALLLAAPWAPSSMATALPPLSPLIWAWGQAAHPDLQRWTFALSAVVDEAIAVILLCLAWRPLARPLLAQFLALALLVDVAANIPFDPQVVVAYASLLLLLVVYPEPRWLLTPIWRGPVDGRLVALAVAAGVVLFPSIWQALQAQVAGADELAANYGWASTVEHLVNLWLITLLAAFRQPGSALLALLVAVCLLYLGLAAIAVPGNPGSWGISGGALAIAGGATYLALTLPSLRRTPHPPTGEPIRDGGAHHE